LRTVSSAQTASASAIGLDRLLAFSSAVIGAAPLIISSTR
jgi:hypothetical protein